jgi:hypothetical protein
MGRTKYRQEGMKKRIDEEEEKTANEAKLSTARYGMNTEEEKLSS